MYRRQHYVKYVYVNNDYNNTMYVNYMTYKMLIA